MSSRVNEVNGENLQDPQSKIPMQSVVQVHLCYIMATRKMKYISQKLVEYEQLCQA